jgi:putative DNA primase/helicase
VQAQAALQLLLELLEEFPFVADVDRAVAVAGLMTPVLRGAIAVAPLFFYRTPESGTGKSYLVKLTGALATGRLPIPLASSQNPEEMEKRLTAALVEAAPILNLNNLDFDLESALLCQMVTEGIVKIRPFRQNEVQLECDCRAITAYANGNNIRIVGDLVRRTVTGRMDAKMENPETRPFKREPVTMVLRERGKYLAAVFTIVRGYIAAGCPAQADAANVAGFEQWSRLVRYPLLWLGMADPIVSMEDARALDPLRGALAERIQALIKCFGVGKEFTASDVHKRALEIDYSSIGVNNSFRNQELFDSFSRDGRISSAKSIGNQLMKDLGRVSDGCCVELAVKNDKTSNRYRLVGTPTATVVSPAAEQL